MNCKFSTKGTYRLSESGAHCSCGPLPMSKLCIVECWLWVTTEWIWIWFWVWIQGHDAIGRWKAKAFVPTRDFLVGTSIWENQFTWFEVSHSTSSRHKQHFRCFESLQYIWYLVSLTCVRMIWGCIAFFSYLYHLLSSLGQYQYCKLIAESEQYFKILRSTCHMPAFIMSQEYTLFTMECVCYLEQAASSSCEYPAIVFLEQCGGSVISALRILDLERALPYNSVKGFSLANAGSKDNRKHRGAQ